MWPPVFKYFQNLDMPHLSGGWNIWAQRVKVLANKDLNKLVLRSDSFVWINGGKNKSVAFIFLLIVDGDNLFFVFF